MGKIDFTKFIVVQAYNKYEYEFEILLDSNINSERLFIDYKTYFKLLKNKLGSLKAFSDLESIQFIGDIKRVIECKTKFLLLQIGYNKPICKENYPELAKIPGLKKLNDLTLISYLLDLDLDLIFQSRTIRNKAEHDFYIPSIQEIKNSMASCEMFLIILKNMFSSNRFAYYIVTDEKREEEITIQPFKENGVGKIAFNSKIYNSNEEEYTLILRYILARNFNNIPRKLFGVNEKMPIEHINCIGCTYIEDGNLDDLDLIGLYNDSIDYI